MKFNLLIADNNVAKKATIFGVLIQFFLLMLFPIMISAQSSSGATGVITDTTGAIVPGVQVTLTDTKTSRDFTTTSNDQGVYVFPNIQPGDQYKLTFTKEGFQSFVLNSVQLGVGKTETYNAQLSVGDVSATVEVTSTAGDATLNTTDASVGNVIGRRQLQDLPVQFRGNPASLLGLQPGAIGTNVGTGNTNRVGSVTGSRADQQNITVDGLDSNDQASGQAFSTIGNLPIDSVQEFRAVTANPAASEGRSSGAQIQLVTNSGTNEYHGSARIYYRSDKFAANEFFNNRNGVPRPGLQRRQFGASLGGPLPFFNFGDSGPAFISGKTRLFFFFDYEGRRDDSQTSVLRIVPLQNFREGRIGYINNNAGCTNASRQDTTPNCISFLTPAQASALDPARIGVNQALLNFINSRYPQANDLNAGNGINTGGLRFNAPDTRADNTYTTRIDWTPTDAQKVFGRLSLTRVKSTNLAAQFPGDPDAEMFVDNSYQWVVGHSWILSPSFFNQAIVGLSASKFAFPLPESPAFPNSFGTTSLGGVLQEPFADIAFQDRDVYTPVFRDDATWTKGSHTIQFGGQFKPIRQNSTLVNDINFVGLGLGGGITGLNSSLRPANIRNTAGATGNFDAAYTLLLGRIASVATLFNYDTNGSAFPLGTGKKREFIYNEYELYVQDNWRLRSDLTLNLGLRYHLYPAPYEKDGFQTGFTNTTFQELLDRRIANAAAGISGPNSEPLLTYDLIGKANDGRPYYETDKNNFAPRIGFNYNPSFKSGLLGAIFGDRKTAIRGASSIIYDRVGGVISFLSDQNSYLFDSVVTTNGGNLATLATGPRFVSLTAIPIINTPTPITRPITPNVDDGIPVGTQTSQGNYTTVQDFETPYSYQWSLGVQRELPGNFILDVSYVGRQGRKLFAQADPSQLFDFRDRASGQFLFGAFNAVQAELNAGTARTALAAQPWIENQVGSQALNNYGLNCSQISSAFLGVPSSNCTQLAAALYGGLFLDGGSADIVKGLYQNSLLEPNVGLSSQFAFNRFVTNYGRSNYNGLLVSLQKRFSQGFQFDVNYTWSHAIDNNSSVTNTTIGGLVCDIRNLDACRGDSDFDIRHLVNANGIWQLPFGRGRAIGGDSPKWLDAVIGGWTLSGIFAARSGLPLSSLSGAFPVGFVTESPAVLVGNRAAFAANVRDEGTGIQYFADPAAAQDALRYPRHGESGNRNIFRSPAFWNVDMALSKRFKMPWSENHMLMIRVEAYNVTNSVSFTSPDLTFGSSTFGRITNTQSAPRELQFGLRYDF